MLKPNKARTIRADGANIVVVASQYNAHYVDAMLRAAKAVLRQAGVNSLRVVRVPGAYEIPVVAARVARQAASQAKSNGHAPRMAIICLGVILRGETVHAAHIGEAVSRALMEIQLRYEIPVIHEVLLLENEAQARARCLGKTHNRGTEAAQTALSMARLLEQL
jgi:6,7-dimethyl-8-ribityllumazine synthase